MSQLLSKNATLSHYRIISKLGAGGMGEVYLAQDTKLGRKLALKILPADVASNGDRMERFVREAKAAAALNHPNIAHVYEIDESDGTHFIAMEFIDGVTLRAKIHHEETSLPKLLKYLTQVAEGLNKAHAVGIVHRDLKPDNIMITIDDYAKVLDFGLAKLVEPQKGFGSSRSNSSEVATAILQQQSIAGMVMGTAGYMSPEQASGRVHEIDHRSDIFSFGCILFEAASGQRAFGGKDALDSIHKIVHAPTPVLKDVNPLAPEDLQRVVRRCLAKEADKRYQSMKEVAIEIEDLQLELKNQAGSFRSTPKKEQSGIQFNSSSQTSLLVLPFTNNSADEENEYFCDGLTEELISDLSKVRSLRVISRNSAMRLKGIAKDTRSIASDLNVQYVLAGSVRKAGQSLRISVELIDGVADANLWSEKYQGTLADIFEMQESVSRSIVDALKITLSDDEQRQMEERPIADPRAYDLYLKARAQFLQGVPSALDRAIELLNQGLRIIGENELLYAALGYSYYFYFRWVSKLNENYLRLANECMEKTFALNPKSSHGLTLKGLLSYSAGNITEAIRSLKQARAVEPTNTEALLWLAVNNSYIDDYKAAMKYADEARLLDPLLPINTLIKGVVYLYHGEFTEALIWANRGLAMDPLSPILIWSAAIVKAWCGKTDEAIAHVDDLAKILPEWVYTQHGLFLKHAMRGEQELGLQYATPELIAEARHDCHFALHVAHCFALIRENDKAFEFLELAVRKGMLNYRFLGEIDPLLENLRNEERFRELMKEARALSSEAVARLSGQSSGEGS
jgi:non-specific serine/threonine protein kinase